MVRTPILSGGGRHGAMLRPVDGGAERRMYERLRPLDPERFAERALRAVARNRAIVILPGWWRLFWWLDRLSPALGDQVWRRFFDKTRAELWPESDGDGLPP